jgi:electron transfer flavoprotein alpha subunit
MSSSGKLLVFVDLPDGTLNETGKGLLAYSARLAVTLGTTWGVVTAVEPDQEQLNCFGSYGTPSITCLLGGEALLSTPAILGKSLALLADSQSATVVLFPHNDLGSSLAPVVAVERDSAIVTELITVQNNTDGVRLSRRVLGNRMAESKVWDRVKTLVVTVPPRSLSQVLLATVRGTTPKVASWYPTVAPTGVTTTITSRIPADPQTVDLTEADVIFSAGKGCNPTTFAQLQELCRLLNVSFGVTRPVWDMGWTGFERMIGQTGRTVTPRLYLALGISGSMHHIGGIKDSRRLVAVNIDAKAPIFPNTDEGFVADLNEVLPKLVDRVRSKVGGTQ